MTELKDLAKEIIITPKAREQDLIKKIDRVVKLTKEIEAKEGPKGDKGDIGGKGDKGDSIKGEKGEKGNKGVSIKGDRGERGKDGKNRILIKPKDGRDGKDAKDWTKKIKDIEWRIENINTKRASIFNRSDAGSFNKAISDSRYYKKDEVDAINIRAFVNGSFKESFDAIVTSNGTIVTMSIEKTGTGDLTMQFSDGSTTLDTTPALTIALTAGSDASPTENFIYILKSDKILTKSTSDWPTVEHNKIGYFLVPSATFVQADGVYLNQNWNDFLSGANDMGHMLHITERSRLLGAVYHKGVAGDGDGGTYVVRTNATPDTVFIKTTSGEIYQMHKHTVPAYDTSGSDSFLVVNQHTDNGGAYDKQNDLYNLLEDANSGSMTGKYFNLILWGTANKSGEFDPLMINLPTGSYSKQTDAENDVSGFDVFAIPAPFQNESSVGFLIARLTMKHSSGTQDLELISTVDLRGVNPIVATNSGGAISTEFADNSFKIFDESDVSKLLQFQLSGVSTGNTRTITIPDRDLDLANPTFDSVTMAGDINPDGDGTRDLGTETTAQWANVWTDKINDNTLSIADMFHAYDAVGDIILAVTDTVMTLDTEVKKTSAFTHAADSSEITINTTGTYLITYYISTYITLGAARSTSDAHLELNSLGGGSWTDIAGTYGGMYNRTVGFGKSNATVTRIIDLVATDVIRLVAKKVGTDTVKTFPNSVGITITQASGAGLKGDTGSTGAGVVTGIITIWSGTLANIPAGWIICDGSNGTPDLRGRFVKSIDTTEDPGTTGGSTSHSHCVEIGTDIGCGFEFAIGTDSMNHLPPFYEIAFIMKT